MYLQNLLNEWITIGLSLVEKDVAKTKELNNLIAKSQKAINIMNDYEAYKANRPGGNINVIDDREGNGINNSIKVTSEGLINFGKKHMGKHILDVLKKDKSYIDWMIRERIITQIELDTFINPPTIMSPDTKDDSSIPRYKVSNLDDIEKSINDNNDKSLPF